MAEYLPVIVVGGIAYAVSNMPYIKDFSAPVSFMERKVDYSVPVYSEQDNIMAELDEYEASGYPYGGIHKASNLEMTNINDAWKPYGPPRQMESKGVFETYVEEAKRNAYVRRHGIAPYIQRHEMEIPLATAQQSNPNVSVPSADMGDSPLAPLTYYPRVWIDEENWDKGHALADPEWRVWGSNSFPSEWLPGENHDDEGRMSKFFYPWGCNGNYIRLFNKQQYDEQKNNFPEVKRDVVLQPNLRHYKYGYDQPKVERYRYR